MNTNSEQNRTIFLEDDPQLAGLSAEQLAYLNKTFNDHAKIPSVRVTNVNSRIDPPQYNPDRMTSGTFFSKCEKYLTAQGFSQSQYHTMVHIILKDNMKSWYDSISESINSWAEFKAAFVSRFDNSVVQEKRKQLLWTRKQEYFESCEQFIQEMVTLAKQINPSESEHASVNRAFNALIPDLRLNTGLMENLTINSLLEKLACTYDAIKGRDTINGTRTRLPPLYGYKVDRGPQYQSSRGRGRPFLRGNGFHQRSHSLPNNFNRNNFFPRQSGYYSQYNAPHQPQQQQQLQQSQMQQRQQPQLLQQNSSSSSSFPQSIRTAPIPPPPPQGNIMQTNENNSFRNRSNTLPFTRFGARRDKSFLRCHNCNSFGHFAYECNNAGVVNCVIPNSQQPSQNQLSSNILVNPSQIPSTSGTSRNLNDRREAPRDSNPGSSRF